MKQKELIMTLENNQLHYDTKQNLLLFFNQAIFSIHVLAGSDSTCSTM